MQRGLDVGSQGLRLGVGGCALSCCLLFSGGGHGGFPGPPRLWPADPTQPRQEAGLLSFLDSGVSLPRESGGLETGLCGWQGPLTEGLLAAQGGNREAHPTLIVGPGEGSVAALPVVLRGGPAEGASWPLVLLSPSAPSPCPPCCVSPRSLAAQAFGPAAVTPLRVCLGLLGRWPPGAVAGARQGEAVRPLVPGGPPDAAVSFPPQVWKAL